MSVKFFKNGNNVKVIRLNDELVTDTLEVAVYVLNFDEMQGYYLTYDKDYFNLPKSIYGNSQARCDKVVHTYNNNDKSLGVLLSGNKGTGKTLTSSLIANTMLKQGVPVIIVNQAFTGNGFTEILNNIGECVVFFDEFGKVYNQENDQPELLTLFDGVSSQKRLFIITENELKNINEFFLERPSRIYYHFAYGKLEKEIIEQYCLDNNLPELTVNQIKDISYQMNAFSFDMLQTIVNEYKVFGGNIEEIVKDLNVGYNPNITVTYEVLSFTQNNKNLKMKKYDKTICTTSGGGLRINHTIKNEDEEYEDYEYFYQSNLVYEKDNEYLFKKNNFMLKVKKIDTQQFRYDNHF